MPHLLLKTLIALISLILLSQLAVWAMPNRALAQPTRPTLSPAPPAAPTRKPSRNPTETPGPTATETVVPTATEPPAATAAPESANPPVPTAVPAQLPLTGGVADWNAALLLALLLVGTGMALRLRGR